eukprot:1079083-Amphidinium_carterae.1
MMTCTGKAMWVSYLGLVRRRSQSLIMLRLEDRITKKRSPGPGPLRSTEWIKVAKHLVDNKRIILRTDGAKAYMADFEQFRHTKVTASSMFPTHWLTSMIVSGLSNGASGREASVLGRHWEPFWRPMLESGFGFVGRCVGTLWGDSIMP